MSVPRRSPVTSTIPKHRLPILLLANSRDMWKCNWDTVNIRQKWSKSATPAKLLNFLWDFPQSFNLTTSKSSNSTRLPQGLNVATSKTKQFCEATSSFERGNVKNEGILRDVLNFRSWQHQKRNNSARLPWKIESWVQSLRPCTNAFCEFSTPHV